MLDWITDGIINSFNPEDVDLLFVLDNPTDGSAEKLSEICRTKLKGFQLDLHIFHDETFKFPCQNWMMEYVFVNGYKSLIAPQDDQKINDKNLIKNIDKIFDQYGDLLGCIGLRDGFEFGYHGMVSSKWSESEYRQPRLENGEFKEVKLINDGPIIYPYTTIKTIGYNDIKTYKRFYIEDDYAQRCWSEGLKNIVLGNELFHQKLNCSKNTTHYSNNDSELDIKAFKNKWNY